MKSPLFAGLAAVALLAACAETPPPARPIPQAAASMPTPAMPQPAMPTGDGRIATINFTPMSAGLSPMASSNLGLVTERLMANPRSRVVITTYAGPNDSLISRERGQAVRQALLDSGVTPDRIRVTNARMTRGAAADGVQVQVSDGPTRR